MHSVKTLLPLVLVCFVAFSVQAQIDTELPQASTDTEPPVLVSLTVDKTSVDVSESEQTVTFTLAFTDETGIKGGGYTYINLTAPNGSTKYVNNFQTSISSPVTGSTTLSSTNAAGNWKISSLSLRDPADNQKVSSSAGF